MYGAIIGDLAGSIYEYGQIKEISHIDVDKLIKKNSFYSDDTVLTIAVLSAILKKRDYCFYLKKYIKEYYNKVPKGEKYFEYLFSPNMIEWTKGTSYGESIGNGAMMRISPVGYLFNNEQDVIENAYLATCPSHDSIEAINSATKIALIIYYARRGFSKDTIIKKLKLDIKYTPFTKFNSTCSETIDNCLYAAFNSSSFEDSLKDVISYGGDTDTNACITGSIAEALYGIDESLIEQAREKLPSKFVRKLDKGYAKIKRL